MICMLADDALVRAMEADLREAWEIIRHRYPTERVYAFGLYTDTEDVQCLRPFACGEEGLRRVAARYVKAGHHASIDEAAVALRWSIADSPYQDRLPSKRI